MANPALVWFNPLARFLNLVVLVECGRDVRWPLILALQEEGRQEIMNCLYGAQLPELSVRVEKGVLHAVMRTLEGFYGDLAEAASLTDTQRQELRGAKGQPERQPTFPVAFRDLLEPSRRRELRDLHSRALRAAQNRLEELSGKGVRVPPEWEGDEWEEQDGLVKRLLLFMHGRGQADLEELCLAVWGRDCADVSEPARAAAISKARSFLRKLESTRILRYDRGDKRLRWK